MPQNPGAAAFAALQVQLGNVQTGALQACPQAAIFKVYTIQQRQYTEFVGAKLPIPAWGTARARQGGIGVECAADPPTWRCKQSPDANIGHGRLDRAVDWGIFGPAKAFWAGTQLAANIGVNLACTLGVPDQLPAQVITLGTDLQAQFLQAGTHATASQGTGLYLATLCIDFAGTAASHDGDVAGFTVFNQQTDITAGTLQQHIGTQLATCGVDIPAALHDQIAAHSSVGEQGFCGAGAECIDPSQRNAAETPLRLHRPIAIASLAQHGRLPLDAGRCGALVAGWGYDQLAAAGLDAGAAHGVAGSALAGGDRRAQFDLPCLAVAALRAPARAECRNAGLPIGGGCALCHQQACCEVRLQGYRLRTLLGLAVQVDAQVFRAARKLQLQLLQLCGGAIGRAVAQ